MSFGLNRVELIGRLGADVTVNHLTSGGRVANLSVATDESYITKTGERVDKTEWHRIVTFQDGLIDDARRSTRRKGRLVYIAGKLQTRRWSKPGEDGDRFSTEILLVPGGRIQFLERPNGNGAWPRRTNSPTRAPWTPCPPPTPCDASDRTVLKDERHPRAPDWAERFTRLPFLPGSPTGSAASTVKNALPAEQS